MRKPNHSVTNRVGIQNREKVKPIWPEDIKPGGLGVCLIHDIMDKVEFLDAPSGKGNLLRMVKYLENDANGT